jgi:hypothetical protein
MSQPTAATNTPHEPALQTVELLCERLGEMGMPIGPDTAREILRAVLAVEATRMEAHVHDALQTALDTIRIAAQAGLGALGTTTPVQTRPLPSPPKPVLDPPARRAPPPTASTPRPSRRPTPKRAPDVDLGDDLGDETRPVFRRPRGR